MANMAMNQLLIKAKVLRIEFLCDIQYTKGTFVYKYPYVHILGISIHLSVLHSPYIVTVVRVDPR